MCAVDMGADHHLYEKAAETDGELARPREPNWAAWANDVRLMCSQDQRTHYQICKMFKRVQSDPFWCRNILSRQNSAKNGMSWYSGSALFSGQSQKFHQWITPPQKGFAVIKGF